MQVNTSMMEIHKPSELCQIVCMDNEKNLTGSLNTTQLDIMNFLLYASREDILKSKISQVEEFYKIDITLKSINTILGFNSFNVYKHIIENLMQLKKQLFVINALGKNKSMECTITSFIHKITFSKHKDSNSKSVKLVLDGDIINLMINTKKLFSKMFLKIQFSMTSKYSKLLYEILKDYENINHISIELEMLYALLNVDTTKKSNTQWSSFRANILDKSIKEINEKSDIFVSYEPIKEKPEGERLQVTKIKFTMKSQPESRLQELGLIQESIIDNKFYNKSKSKLDKLIKGGYNVIDEEMWLETDIKKNELKYESEMRIDIWLKETEQTDKNFIYESIANSIDECEDPMVIIEDYLIRGLFSKETFTKNASETIDLLNKSIKNVIEN